MPKHIFVSYRSVDAEFALKVAVDLKNAGVRLWMDRLDIKPGDDWRRALQKGIQHSAAILSILTPRYILSPYCQRELARADRMKTPIIPLLVEQIVDEDWPIEVERHQYIDFTAWQQLQPYDDSLKRLVDHLQSEYSDLVQEAPKPSERYLNSLVAELGKTNYEPEGQKFPVLAQERPQPMMTNAWRNALPLQVTTPDKKRHEIKSIRDLFERYPRLAIVGPPGSGKTTMQEMLLLHMVNSDQSNRIPYLVRFDTSTEDVVSFMQLRWSLDADLLQLGRMGKVIFFFDGIDMLSASASKQFHQWLKGQNAPQRYVMATLSANELDIPRVQIAPLSIDEIEAFINSALPATPAMRLFSRIKSSEIYPLADHPAMLQALVNIEWSDAVGALFDRFAKRLIADECQRQDALDIDQDELWRAIAKVAFDLLEDDAISVEQAQTILGGQAHLHFCQRANILQVQDGNVSFTFYQLRDYFVAVWLEQSGTGIVWLQSNIEWKKAYELVMRCWVGITSTPDVLLDLLADEHAELALQSITPTIRAQQETVNKIVFNALSLGKQWVYRFPAPVINGLVHALRAKEWPLRIRACQILLDADIEPSHAIVSTLTDLRPDLHEAAAYGIMQLREAIFPSLIALLRHHEVQLRHNATWALSQLRDRAAVPPLVAALNDTDESVGLQAIRALGQRNDADAVIGVIDSLLALEEKVRMAAIEYLNVRHATAIEYLITVSSQGDVAARINYIEVLASIAHSAAGKALVQLTDDDDMQIKEAAIRGLSNFEGDDVLACLGTFIVEDEKASADMQRLSQIAKEILSQRSSPAAKVLLNATRHKTSEGVDGDDEAQRSADKAVERLSAVVGSHVPAQPPTGDAARLALIHAQREASIDVALEVLSKALTDTLTIRLAAVEVLSEIEDKRAIKLLRNCLINDLEPVREAAAVALASTSAEDVLLDAHKDASAELSTAIEKTLDIQPSDEPKTQTSAQQNGRSASSVDFLSRLIEDIRHLEWGKREESAKALKEYTMNLHEDDKPAVIEKLAGLIEDNDKVLKWVAIEGLGWMKDARAAQALVPALHDENWTIRVATLRSLAEIGDTSIVRHCLERLSDPKTGVREAAVETLGALKDPQAADSLIQILQDDDPFMRLAAVVALHQIEAPGVAPALVRAASDADRNVRWSAVYALRDRPHASATGVLRSLLHDTEQPYWDEDRVCDLALEALRKIDTPEAREAVKNHNKPVDV